jgi:hypothetical protein
MRDRVSNLLLALLVLLAASTSALPHNTEDVVTAYVEGSMTAVIAFLPLSMQDSQVSAAAEAQASVRLAIEDTKRCLGEDDVSYRVVFAERIVVRSPAREETFDIGYFAPLVGALLLRPGTNARILFAGGGPEALAQTLRSAASEYFQRRCKGG